MAKVIKKPKRYKGITLAQMRRQWGVNSNTCGAKGIRLGISIIPPGGRTKPHYHSNCETALYQIKGPHKLYVGPNLDRVYDIRPGDFVYIPKGEYHLSVNPSKKETYVAIVAQNAKTERAAGYTYRASRM